MLVKPKYTSEEEAPVRFLKLICVTIPIACVIMLFEITALSHKLPLYFTVFYIFILIMNIIAAIGLNFRRWFGVIVYIVDTAILSISDVYRDWLDVDIYMIVGRIIAEIIFFIIILIYFGKRRLLFSPPPKNYQENILQSIPTQKENKMDNFSNNENAKEIVNEAHTSDSPQLKISMPEAEPEENKMTFYQEEKKTESEKRTYSPLDPPDEKSKRTSSIIISIICILVCLLVGASGWIAAYFEKQEISHIKSNIEELKSNIEVLQSDNATLKNDKTALKVRNGDLQKELDTKENMIDLMLPAAYVTEKQIGFIVNGSKYYHQFKCSVYQAEDEFLAHNIEYCEYLGYKKCPLCWKETADEILYKYGATRSDSEKTTGGKFIKLVPKS